MTPLQTYTLTDLEVIRWIDLLYDQIVQTRMAERTLPKERVGSLEHYAWTV